MNLKEYKTIRELIKFLSGIPVALIDGWKTKSLSTEAQSLVFVSLLTLVPLLAVAFSLLHGFGIHGVIEPWLQKIFKPMGQAGVEVAGYILKFVEQSNASNLGIIGIVFLLFSVINIAGKIENSLNNIWSVKNAKGFHKRVSGYFSAILLAPLLIAAIVSSMLGMKNAAWLQPYLAHKELRFIFDFLTVSLPVVIVFIALSFIYWAIPARQIKKRSAFAGALFFVILWFPLSAIFSRFIAKSASYPAIYSSFAVIIILLFWMYYLWLIFLCAARVCVYVEKPQVIKYQEWTAGEILKTTIAVAQYLAIKFNQGEKLMSLHDLQKDLPFSPDKCEFVMQKLVASNLWTESRDNPVKYIPTKNPNLYSMYEIYLATTDKFLDDEYLPSVCREIEMDLQKILAKNLVQQKQ